MSIAICISSLGSNVRRGSTGHLGPPILEEDEP